MAYTAKDPPTALYVPNRNKKLEVGRKRRRKSQSEDPHSARGVGKDIIYHILLHITLCHKNFSQLLTVIICPPFDYSAVQTASILRTGETPSQSIDTVQYSTVQYSTVQYSTVQYSTVQYSTVQYSTVQYSTVQYSTVQYSTVQYSTVQYGTVQYSTVQYNIIQYCTVQTVSILTQQSIDPCSILSNHLYFIC